MLEFAYFGLTSFSGSPETELLSSKAAFGEEFSGEIFVSGGCDSGSVGGDESVLAGELGRNTGEVVGFNILSVSQLGPLLAFPPV